VDQVALSAGVNSFSQWGDLEQRYDLKSSTKSFGAAALGVAIKDGKMQLSDKARSHHPTLGTPPNSNADTGWLDEITILHLASQTAGFDKPGGYVPVLFRPGTEWSYSDGGPNWLAECITLAYHRDLDELMFERIFTPLGIRRSDLTWRKNSIGPICSTALSVGSLAPASAPTWMRWRASVCFGCCGGEWKGVPLLPRDYVDKVRSTVPGVPGLTVRVPEHYGRASNHYGLLWWNNADETIEGLPIDTYWTWGLYDSLIVVMPTLDIVVARAGQSWKRVNDADHYEVLKASFSCRSSPPQAQSLPRRTRPLRPAQPILPAQVIRGIDWAPPDTIIRRAKGSDNWPMHVGRRRCALHRLRRRRWLRAIYKRASSALASPRWLGCRRKFAA
jgi:CubicO group peptidase (beta-lactamase class C family)